MALRQIYFVEDPEHRISPGYYEIDGCMIRVYSMAIFGLARMHIFHIYTPRPETAFKVIAKCFETPPKRIRMLSDEEIRAIIAEASMVTESFFSSDQEVARSLLKQAMKPKPSVRGISGGLPYTGIEEEGDKYQEDQLDSNVP